MRTRGQPASFFGDLPPLVKPKRAAEVLDMSERGVRWLMERGDLEVVRISERVVRIPRASLERLVERGSA